MAKIGFIAVRMDLEMINDALSALEQAEQTDSDTHPMTVWRYSRIALVFMVNAAEAFINSFPADMPAPCQEIQDYIRRNSIEQSDLSLPQKFLEFPKLLLGGKGLNPKSPGFKRFREAIERRNKLIHYSQHSERKLAANYSELNPGLVRELYTATAQVITDVYKLFGETPHQFFLQEKSTPLK